MNIAPQEYFQFLIAVLKKFKSLRASIPNETYVSVSLWGHTFTSFINAPTRDLLRLSLARRRVRASHRLAVPLASGTSHHRSTSENIVVSTLLIFLVAPGFDP